MENQGFRLVEEKKQKKSYFALILSIFTVAGILFCVQQMFVDTKWWFISMFVSIICSAFIFSTKSTKIVLVYFVLGILLLFAFRCDRGISFLFCCTELYEQRTCYGGILLSYGVVFIRIFDNCNQRKTLGSCPCFLGSACIFGCIF